MPFARELSEETKHRFIEAATQMFAVHGFSNTTVRELAKAAHCHVGAINYHFGSKEKLYQAVVLKTFRQLSERRVASLRSLMERTGGHPSLEAVVHAFAHAFLDPFLHEEQADIRLRLVLHEMVHQLLPRQLVQRELIDPVNKALMQALSAAAPELDQETLALAIYSLVAQLVHVVHLHWFAPTRAAEYTSFGPLLLDHIVRFTSGGIKSLQKALIAQEAAC
ncbi:MAG: CerR family C-terminal domain-containing protein [Thermoanaerobaculum sp.]|nr:CerR family C-terminal domain-containing protein [Thermoanaerobaculum sp.]MDW7967624.1 TetR family transcriptional regulator [Thermoanaerobaculum sp.]